MNLMVDNKNRSGIYKITNTTNRKVYIGKTKNFHKRYYQYLYGIKNKDTNRINRYLLASIEKYGVENFTFEVIEFCDIDSISDRELYWMEFYKSTDRNFGYNLRLDSSTGMIVHPETSEKISNRLKYEWESGVRDRHSDKLKLSWEHRDRSDQGLLLTKILTKYKYIVVDPEGITVEMYYKDLKLNELSGVVSKFYKKKCNMVRFKGFIIERIECES